MAPRGRHRLRQEGQRLGAQGRGARHHPPRARVSHLDEGIRRPEDVARREDDA